MTFPEIIELISKIIGMSLTGLTLLAIIFKKPKEWITNGIKKISCAYTEESMKPFVLQLEQQHETISQILVSVDAIQEQNNEQSKSMETMNITQDEVLSKIKVNEETSLDLLRYNFNRIYSIAKQDNFISAHDKENCCTMYKNYKDLKGNSYVDELYKEIMLMPVKYL